MSNSEALRPDRIINSGSGGNRRTLIPEPSESRQLRRRLGRVGGRTLVNDAEAMSAGSTARRKVREFDGVAREAMTGQAMLSEFRDAVGGTDPLLHDELGMFMDIARMGKAQILTDLLDAFSRETRP